MAKKWDAHDALSLLFQRDGVPPKMIVDDMMETIDRYEDDKKHQTHMPEVDYNTPEAMDNYIRENIMISHGDTVDQGSVRHRKSEVEGKNIGRAKSNPILDTQTYEVEFEDERMITYSANFIAEIMYAQCDK